MLLYVDDTKESKKATAFLVRTFGPVPLAPASGSGLPEFIREGISYVGLSAILKMIKEQPEAPVGYCSHCRRKTHWTVWKLGAETRSTCRLCRHDRVGTP
jgi:hypothetical protein